MNIESILILIALLSDILYPLMNWKLGLPSEFRWVSQAICLVIIVIGFLKVIRLQKFKIVWAFIAFWLFFSAVFALLNGQSLGATAWGLYSWLRYPLIGLYAFVSNPALFEKIKKNLPFNLMILAALNLLAQLIQFAAGEPIGDDLAGLWGPYGTNRLTSFLCLTLAFQIGNWIVTGKSRNLLFLMVTCFLSSILGEMKVFFVIFILYALVASLIYGYKRRRVFKSLIMVVTMILGAFALIRLYDFVAKPSITLASYFNYDRTYEYMNFLILNPQGMQQKYNIGRFYQVSYVWDLISRDPITMWFGNGIGSQRTSQALEIYGVGLLSGSLGSFSGNTLSTLIGDFGIVGICIAVFSLASWVWSLLFAQRRERKQDQLKVGLAIFVCTLPLLMFFMDIWTTPITMLIFWLVFGQSYRTLGKPVSQAMSNAPLSSVA